MSREITMKEAQAAFGYSERHIRKVVRENNLAVNKKNNTYRYDYKQLQQALSRAGEELEIIKRNEVDWDKASCRGINTDMFYLEEDLLKNKKAEHRQLRNICFRCPIQRACLEVGFSHERYGFWGGLSALERQEIVKDRLDSTRIAPLRRDCAEFGVPFEEIIEASLVERVYDEVNY